MYINVLLVSQNTCLCTALLCVIYKTIWKVHKALFFLNNNASLYLLKLAELEAFLGQDYGQ